MVARKREPVVVGALIGAVTLGIAGSQLGVAGGGGAINGAIPGMVVGAALGCFIANVLLTA